MPALLRYTLAVLLLAAAAVVDWATGAELSVQFFYLLSIGLMAWFDSFPAAAVLAVISTGVVLFLNLHDLEPVSRGSPLPYWNALIAAATFLTFALVTSALSRAQRRLKELARLDPLTGIANRRSFMEKATAELVRSRRSGRPFSLMYVDVDNFKRVNDTLGHSAGDTLLRTVSSELCIATRETDVVARLGGDEFAVLLPETEPAGGKDAAEKIRGRLLASATRGGWPVTFSVGLVCCDRAPRSLAALVDTADRLMYSIKNSGKDGLAAQVL
ncbi:MAG TPA: GGDEF domain-containing protein [Spirochaetia bacterium]|nr:GGDEF domain-containing protein [Spirochaetia bacterium]